MFHHLVMANKPLKSSRPNATATTIIERLHSSSAMVFRYMDISQFNQQKRIYTNNGFGFTQFARIYFRVAWHVRFRFWPWACIWWKCTVFSMKLYAFVIVYRAVAPMQSMWGKTHTETYRRNKNNKWERASERANEQKKERFHVTVMIYGSMMTTSYVKPCT